LIGAWLVHVYTASGIVLAFLAAREIIDFDYRTAFFWLWIQVLVDATDGWLARLMRVRERIPWFDGAKLDDIADYLTYVFVPALFVWRGALVPNAWALPVAAAMLLSSAYGFNRSDAKTADHFFTGFPSYWNVVTFYLLIARWPSEVNAVILVVLAVLVLVPIRYVYPSRTRPFRVVTNVGGVIWGGLLLFMLWEYPVVSLGAFWISLAYPAYYLLLSFALHFRLIRSET
jgi:phosphatidylcholine synthase